MTNVEGDGRGSEDATSLQCRRAAGDQAPGTLCMVRNYGNYCKSTTQTLPGHSASDTESDGHGATLAFYRSSSWWCLNCRIISLSALNCP
jgi:hypothetical protein